MAATHKKNLRTGVSIWQARRSPSFQVSRIAKKAGKFDVVIVGAGISGAMVAEALTDAGLTVAIVDRRGALKGSTPASTSLVQYELDVPLTKLARKIGKTKAQRIWSRSRLALDALRERSRILGIEAGCVNRDTLYLEGDILDARSLAHEFNARREIGLETSFLSAADVKKRFGISGRAALLGYDNFAADPVRLAGGFLHAALQRGARLYAPFEVANINVQAHGVKIETNDGTVLTASRLIFATGYELPKNVPRMNHSIASTWALATKPQPRRLWPEECFIWEASDPYLYMRTGPQGRVICGGEDEDFSDDERRDAMTDEKIRRIEAKLSALFPHLDPRADYAWTGNFGTSPTGSPTIGPVPRMPNCYAVFGFGGNGITFSAMAAQIFRNMLTGNGDADADLFSFYRKF